MKRLIALLSLFSLCFIPMAQAYDSWDTDWYWSSYYSEIDWMVNNGIMSVDELGNFRSTDCTNRAEFLKVLYSMKGGMIEADHSFSDVPEGSWFEAYVAMAAEEGVVSGYEDGSFKPEQCVTRAEGIKMAIEAFGDELPAADPAYDYFMDWYPDVNEGDWYYETLSWGINIQVVGESHIVWDESYTMGNFLPNESMTREEVAALFYRIQAVIDNDAEYYDFWAVPDPMVELFTRSCSIDKSDVVKNVPLEWGMDIDANALLKIDGTNRGQLRQFAKHVDEIGGGEVWSSLIDNYNWSVSENLSYEVLGEQVVMDDWQLGFTWKDSDNFDGDYAITVSVDQFNEFQEIIATSLWMDYGANLECEAFSDYTLWTVEWADLYVFRYGDLFTFSNSESMRNTLMEQVFAGEGYDEITVDALAYAWMDMAGTVGAMDLEYLGLSPDMADFDEIEFFVEAKTDGFKVTSDVSFANDDSVFLEVYEDEGLELAEEVPAGDSLMIYYEDQDLSLVIDQISQALYYQEDLYAMLSAETGFESETLQHLAESGYAFSMSDSGGAVPNMAFYLHMTHRDEREMASELTAELDAWMASIASQTYYTMEDEIEIDYLVRDENFDGDVHKWSLQADALEMDAESVLAEDDLEIYYGQVEEDIYVIAFYDDFMDDWGTTSVADNRRMEIAADRIDNVNPAKVQFIDFPVMNSWTDVMIERTEGTYDQTMYNEAAAWLDRLGVIYSASYVTHDDLLRQELYWAL